MQSTTIPNESLDRTNDPPGINSADTRQSWTLTTSARAQHSCNGYSACDDEQSLPLTTRSLVHERTHDRPHYENGASSLVSLFTNALTTRKSTNKAESGSVNDTAIVQKRSSYHPLGDSVDGIGGPIVTCTQDYDKSNGYYRALSFQHTMSDGGRSSSFKSSESHFHREKHERTDTKKGICDIHKATIISTIGGSIIFALFHIVLCLAQASAIHRPYSGKPVLGLMVRMAAVGPLISGSLFIYALSGNFAAVYPSSDSFAAPFYVQMAAAVDEALVASGDEDDDIMFLTSYGILTAISLILTGLFLVIGTKVKLVNLSAFLPYPVMCGFFSAAGVLTWTLAFSVDTGEDVWSVLFGGDLNKIIHGLKHHIPSLICGTFLIQIGKRNQGLVPIMALMPIPIVYLGMSFFGTSLKDAQHSGWFWSKKDFSVGVSWGNVDSMTWDPPFPFGFIAGIMQGKAHVPAIINGLPSALSMAAIYFLRCSLHVPALRKSSMNLLKWKEEQSRAANRSPNGNHDAKFTDSPVHDMDKLDAQWNQNTVPSNKMPMSDVFSYYGKFLMLNGLAGGLPCLPVLSVGGTMFKIGAVGAAPQYGSMLLLTIFYLTQFGIVGYLPKLTFSSLLIVGAFELIDSWFIASYKKTVAKSEWIVNPIIVFFTFFVGSLQSVALGLATSIFLFVGSLNKHGVVKYIATGMTVHSVTERNAEDADWLDQNGDLIQLLVLQSYIFFGNANSCLSYVDSMFDPLPNTVKEGLIFPKPPIPKYIIIDMILVSGIDTSSVEIFGEIIQLCFEHTCRVFITGLSASLKEVLSLGGVKPTSDKKSANSVLHFFPDIDSALCTAEDYLLKTTSVLVKKELRRSRIRSNSAAEGGFLYALKEIDNQHSLNTLSKLAGLEPYTKIVELKAGESLFPQTLNSLHQQHMLGGLYFIEYGMMKVERDASELTMRGAIRHNRNDGIMELNALSLSKLHWRMPSVGREGYLIKNEKKQNSNFAPQQYTRRTVARLKPGFVIEILGDSTHSETFGDHIALSPCRLWYLSEPNIEILEDSNPRLILELFKAMHVLSARRQKATIDQLANLHQIMTSVTPTKPFNRMNVAMSQTP